MRKAREAVAVHHDVIGKVVDEVERHRVALEALEFIAKILARPLLGKLRWLLLGR